MNEQEYQAIAKRVEQGETVPALEAFLFRQEKQRRELGPNILERQNAARQENPLLKPRKWSIA